MKEYTRIAIIAALDYEIEALKNELEGRTEKLLAGTPSYEGRLGAYDVVIMKCGIGKVSAALGTQALIDAYAPDLVVNTGCAGGIGRGLKIGDVVIATEAVEWDLDLVALGYPMGYIDSLKCVRIAADPDFSSRLKEVIADEAHVTEGLVVSGDQFVSRQEQREKIFASFPDAQCAEMEGAAVAHTCSQNGIPFCIVRSLSDTADSTGSVDFAKFSEEVSERTAGWLLKTLRK